MIQGNPPGSVFSNYRQAMEGGADSYSMLNISNLRPTVPILQGVSDLTYDPGSFRDAEFQVSYCRHHFDNAGIVRLYDGFFNAFIHRKESDLKKQNARWLDGALVFMVKTWIGIIEDAGDLDDKGFAKFMKSAGFRLQLFKDNTSPIADLIDIENPGNWLCSGWEKLCNYLEQPLKDSVKRWEELVSRVEKKRPEINKGKILYDSNIYWQALTGLAITKGTCLFVEAVRTLLVDRKREASALLKTIAGDISEWLKRSPELAEQSHFNGWLDGDRLMNMPELMNRLLRLSERIYSD